MFAMGQIITLLCSYLIGTIPSGMLVAKSRGIDITQVGSGNVGATNIARNLGKKSGAIVLGIDCLKGIIPLLLTFFLGFADSAWIPLAVVSGHCFSLPGLKGGKGVATALGTLIAYTPLTAAVSLITFAFVMKISRMVSLSSLIATWIAPLFILVTNPDLPQLHSLVGVALLITYRHKDNIDRITKGIENKF